MHEQATRKFFDSVSKGDLVAVSGLLAEDCVLDFPGERFGARLEGKRRDGVFLKSSRRLSREALRFDSSWVGAVGDRVVAQWTNEGPASEGAVSSNRGVTLLSFDAEGRIRDIQDDLDTERLAAAWPR